MPRVALALSLLLMFAAAGRAQDAASESDVATEPAAKAAEPAQPDADAATVDDSDLDDQTYADTENDDFRPSEDIPADQSIPFPTDI